MSDHNKKMKTRLARREAITAWLFMTPAVIGLIIFLIIPFIMAFYLSMTNTRLISKDPAEFLRFRNYAKLLRVRAIELDPQLDTETGEALLDDAGEVIYEEVRPILRTSDQYKDLNLSEVTQFDLFGNHYVLAAGDPDFWQGLKNNFYFVIVVVPITTALALFLAMLVNQKIRGAEVFRTIYFSPVVTSMIVVAVIWTFLLNPGEGMVNAFLNWISFGKIEPQSWLTDPKLAFPSIMLLSIWQGVGFQMVIYLAGLQEIPEDLYEAAAIDGANKIQEFFQITLPLLRNTTIFIVISTTILAFGVFTQIDVLRTTGSVNIDATTTTMINVVRQGFSEQRIGYASAITVIFFLIVLTVSIIQRVLIPEERTVD
jgi:multiple sugar transport system permease protein